MNQAFCLPAGSPIYGRVHVAYSFLETLIFMQSYSRVFLIRNIYILKNIPQSNALQRILGSFSARSQVPLAPKKEKLAFVGTHSVEKEDRGQTPDTNIQRRQNRRLQQRIKGNGYRHPVPGAAVHEKDLTRGSARPCLLCERACGGFSHDRPPAALVRCLFRGIAGSHTGYTARRFHPGIRPPLGCHGILDIQRMCRTVVGLP